LLEFLSHLKFHAKNIFKSNGMDLFASKENMDKYFQQLEQANQRGLQDATAFLTPAQLESLGTFQTDQLKMQQLGMQMAQQMMGGKTNQSSSPNP